jgi:hypothetical protein
MTNNIFTVRNTFCPHKDYNIFLGGKLTMFKFCNYGFVPTKVSRVIFGIVSAYFIVCGFCRTIKAVNVCFVVYDSLGYEWT